MRKSFPAIFLFIICAIVVSAQGDRKIRYRADFGYYDEDFLPGAQRLIGNVKFAQDNVVGYCDSAYFYDSDNYIVAFGSPVRVVVGDSVNLYGHRAYYDGDERKATIGVNVRLENGKSYLLTDSLHYDLNDDCGYYNTGGIIYNDDDTLSSDVGRYYTRTDDAYMNGSVLLKTPSYKMDCDSLRYNAGNKTAYFIAPTHIVGEDNDMFTTGGQYNTSSDITTLHGDVAMNNKSQFLSADSLFYDRKARFGRAWNNVTFRDTSNNFVVKGDYMEHYEVAGTSVVTDNNLLIVIDSNNDSLFLHCDTMLVDIDSAGDIETVRAYYNTFFYHRDIQGACDSMSCETRDSVLAMYGDPVVWSDSYQMTGTTLKLYSLDSVYSIIEMSASGFVVGGLYDDTEFNQIKGVTITGLIEHKTLKSVDIDGNAECIYYLQEEDSTLIGINTSITSKMYITLDSNKIHQIRYYDAPDGQIHPDEELESKERKLTGFRWLDAFRPKTMNDIFTMSAIRNKYSVSVEP